MNKNDTELWATYKQKIAPVASPKRAPPPPKTRQRNIASMPATDIHAPRAAISAPAKAMMNPPVTLERRREKKLRHGDIAIDARLDLHGMTQAVAYDALATFIRRAVNNRYRHLLIITGKGAGGAGILRQNLAAWLAQLPEAAALLALRPASPKHGGAGAFYVILRQDKSHKV